jgi:F-box/leucine-rich repeat protein 13
MYVLSRVSFLYAVAFNKIQHVYHVAVGRVIFKAWHSVTLDAKRTREYFEVWRCTNLFEDEVVLRTSFVF